MQSDGENERAFVAATLTRQEVAELFGVTPQRVIQLEREGTLPKSVRNALGHLRYDAAAVVHTFLRRRRASKTEAATELAAFQLFAEGATVPEIVAALELPSEQVRRLFMQWRTPLGQKVESPEDRERRAQEEHEARMREIEEESARFEKEERARREERDRAWNPGEKKKRG
jgi:DNA-binding transcriptional MerR regulator